MGSEMCIRDRVETELLPHIPDPLFAHIRAAADHLKTIL